MAYVDSHGISESTLTALGRLVELVEITSATMSVYGKIRVTFDRPMNKNSSLSNKLYYSMEPSSPGAVKPYVEDVIIPDVVAPEYIELLTSEHTDGATYVVTVFENGPVSVENLRVDETRNTQSYTGIGDTPYIDRIVAVSENRVDIIFSENMFINDDIKNISKYSFDNGLNILSILEIDGNKVSLVTSDQIPGIIYTLTINP